MVRKWDSILFIGLLLIPFILVVLFYSPAAQAREMYINVINTEDWLKPGDSGDVRIAKLKLGLNEQQYLDNFPYAFEEYQGKDSQDITALKERLRTDTMLMRTYRNTEVSSQPLYLVIVHSKSSGSTHPPPLCYRVAGYKVLEKGQTDIPLSDSGLIGRVEETEDSKAAGEDENLIDRIFGNNTVKTEIIVNKLIVAWVEDEEITERRLVYYTYLTDREFLESEYCLLRVSAIIPVDGPYDDIATAMQEFMGDVFSVLFEDIREPDLTLFNKLTEQGATGIMLLLVIFGIPGFMVGYPLVTRKILVKVKDTGTHEEEPAAEPEKPEIRDRGFILPHDPDDKSGNDKLLAYYENSRYVIEQCIDIDTGSASTLRQFLHMATPELPEEVVEYFSALTKLAETAVYARREPNEGTITEAGNLAGAILRLMKDIPK